ncbi:MAG TPA: polysaccharide deacetylase family protein [Kofleriaceae bacterium]|nr:polysaccharide deacetylase family protein [Kofleriaceae bacterium]
MLPFLAVAPAAAYLLCYGGIRGPVDWLMRTSAHGRRDRARVALTFDDGPDPIRTPMLLDALASEGVKATFFLVGKAVDANPALARRIAREGHELGNHTYRHPYLPLARSRDVVRELMQTDRAIAAATGTIPSLARPPYGGRSPGNVRAIEKTNKRVVLWDVNSFDWRGAPAGEVALRVTERARNGSIILLHDARDGGEATIEAVRLIIPALRAQGLEPVTVSELLREPARDAGELGAGVEA